MTFYKRYAKIAEQLGLDPCSQKVADMLGITKATISSWNIKSSTPKGETVAAIADAFGVSADYLLGRTDDQTDYARGGSDKPKPAADRKTIPMRRPDNGTSPALSTLYARLDREDQLKVEGVIQGLLMQEKYTSPAALPNAAHERTDVTVTEQMIDHDEKIMDDDDF